MIDATELRRLMKYDPDTGVMTRLFRASNWPAGSIAGAKETRGYLTTRIQGHTYKIHRLAWLYMTGEWPTGDIDHVNGDGMDNRWINLREASRSQNCCNASVRRSSATGLKGVHFNRCNNRFAAQIQINKKRIHLGYFDTAEQAHKAYCSASMKLHGEFGRVA